MNKNVLKLFLTILITLLSVISVYAGYIQGNFFDNSGNSVKYVCYDTPGTGGYYSCAVKIPSATTNPVYNNCSLSDGSSLLNGSSKNLYYVNSNGTSCIYASYKCNNGNLIWGTQFSPAPTQPPTGTKLFTTSSSCISSISSSENTGCSGTLPSGAGVVSCDGGCVDFSPVNTIWTYSSNPTTACTWGCSSGYTRTGNSCIQNSTGDTGGDTFTNGYKFVKVYQATQFSPMPPLCNSSQQEGGSCTAGTECILGGGYNLRCQYYGAQSGLIKIENNYGNNIISNCSAPGTMFSFTIWNSTQTIKACIEYSLTAQGRSGENYNCDVDSKFLSLGSPWSFSNGKWSYSTYTQNSTTFVPGKYRLVVRADDGVKVYGDWMTITTSGTFSNPANCNYYAYPAKSVEDALWYLTTTQGVHITSGINWKNIPVPNGCDIYKDVVYKLISNTELGSTYTKRVVSYGDYNKCFTKTPPTWTGPTYTGGFGSQVPGEPDNDVSFDFQSWYNGGDPWTLVGGGCGNVPTHGLSQYYGGIKWEKGKKFDCTNKTYGGVLIGGDLNTGTASCKLGDGSSVQSGITKTLYFSNSPYTSCIDAIFSCTNGQLKRSTQFSPAPPQPTNMSKLYPTSDLCKSGYGISSPINVSYTKTKLNVTNDSLTITVNGLTYENFQGCRTVLAHPTSPSSVDPNKCSKASDYTTIKDAGTNWMYSNGVWKSIVSSDPTSMPSGTKLRSNFRNKDTGEVKSVEWEVIGTVSGNSGCSGSLPTGAGVVSCDGKCIDFSPVNTIWTYSSNPTTACTWGCSSGYTRSGNSCISNSTKPNLPDCGDPAWKTMGTFGCDSQNRETQTIKTCLPPGYDNPMLWNWNKTTNVFDHITGKMCSTTSSSMIWVGTSSFGAPSGREDLLCKNLGYNPSTLDGTTCKAEGFTCYESMWYGMEYTCKKK